VTDPVRTCVGCGERTSQRELVRVKAKDGHVIVDRERSGGRGAWLHPAVPCLDRAVKRRALGRALRADGVRVDGDALRPGLTGNARKD
jgi:uncharacterized protein